MDIKNIHQVNFSAERYCDARGGPIQNAPPATSKASILPYCNDNQKLINLREQERDGEIAAMISLVVLGAAKHLGLRVPVWRKVKSVEFACSRIVIGGDEGFRNLTVKVTTLDKRVYSISNPNSKNKLALECADMIVIQVLANYFPELENEL